MKIHNRWIIVRKHHNGPLGTTRWARRLKPGRYALWLLLFLNTFGGISIISQEAPIFQELVGVSAVVAASMVGIASIGNAFGRVFWAWVSDLITRRATFFVMFVAQVLLFWFSSEHRRNFIDDDSNVRRAHVLWRWLRHHAGVCNRLFWLEECWTNLRSNADSLGLCQCGWPAGNRLHATDDGFLSRRPSCHRDCDGDLGSTADPCLATGRLCRRFTRTNGRAWPNRCVSGPAAV